MNLQKFMGKVSLSNGEKRKVRKGNGDAALKFCEQQFLRTNGIRSIDLLKTNKVFINHEKFSLT